jgi:hypothetical protein
VHETVTTKYQKMKSDANAVASTEKYGDDVPNSVAINKAVKLIS